MKLYSWLRWRNNEDCSFIFVFYEEIKTKNTITAKFAYVFCMKKCIL